MMTEQDEALAALAELERLFSKWGKLTLLSSLQAIDSLTDDLAAANERIARLEGALETAARFHGIDVDVLCEQRVATALAGKGETG